MNQTELKPSAARIGHRLALAALLASAVVLGGCGMSSMTSGFFGSGSSAPPAGTSAVSEEALLAAAKDETGTVDISGAANACPPFLIASADQSVTQYEPGRENDALGVVNRGELTKTARECNVQAGVISIRYGFSGRVLLGPRGVPGPVSLPVAVYLTDQTRQKIQGESLMVDVSVSADRPVGYFSSVRTVTFVVPEGGRAADYKLFVGFEKSAPPTGKSGKKASKSPS